MQTALARSPERRPFPLPQDIAGEHARSVSRAATAAVLNRIRSPYAGRGEKVLAETWPSDVRALQILTRAASAPATTGTAGWAAELAVSSTANAFLGSLAPSAASRLFSRGLQLPLTGSGAVKVPYQAATPSIAPSIVAEGAPIPVRQAAFAVLTLSPKKLAVITAMSSEIAEHSTPSAELIVRQILTESASRALDAAVFTTAAGGLLNGVSGLTPTAAGGQAAFIGDVKLLLDALTAAGAGGGPVMVFAPPSLAAKIAIYAPAFVPTVEVVPTPALAPATIVVVDPAGVVSGAAGQPRIDVGVSSVLHFEDTTPLQIATGAPGSAVLATPTRSAFQTDSFGLRLTLDFAFAARPGFVQFIAAATW